MNEIRVYRFLVVAHIPPHTFVPLRPLRVIHSLSSCTNVLGSRGKRLAPIQGERRGLLIVYYFYNVPPTIGLIYISFFSDKGEFTDHDPTSMYI